MAHLSAKEKKNKDSEIRQQSRIVRKYTGRTSPDVRERFFRPPYGMKVAHEDKEQ